MLKLYAFKFMQMLEFVEFILLIGLRAFNTIKALLFLLFFHFFFRFYTEDEKPQQFRLFAPLANNKKDKVKNEVVVEPPGARPSTPEKCCLAPCSVRVF